MEYILNAQRCEFVCDDCNETNPRGIPETQEMLNFCSEHNIVSDIELIRMDEINEAWERMLKGDVRYRFVVDMGTLG